MSLFEYNQNRDAWATIRGFVYQVNLSILDWLNLLPNQVLELERGEDIDILFEDGGKKCRIFEQVKMREKESLTINTESFIEALFNFCEHNIKNPEQKLYFRYITNAHIGIEQTPIFKDRKAALVVWQDIQKGKSLLEDTNALKGAIIEKINTQITNLSKPSKKTQTDWDKYIDSFNQYVSQTIESDFVSWVKRISIDNNTPENPEIVEEIKKVLDAKSIIGSENLYNLLFAYIFEKLTHKGIKQLTIDERNQIISNFQQNIVSEDLQKIHNNIKETWGDLRQIMLNIQSQNERISDDTQNTRKLVEDMHQQLMPKNNILVIPNKLQILHISDIAYSSPNKYRLERLVENLSKDNIKVDFIFITGNLVNQGEVKELENAYLESTNLYGFINNEKQVIFSCGRNEVDMNLLSEVMTKHLSSFRSSEDIDTFIKKDGLDLNDLLRATNKFYSLHSDNDNHYYQTHKIEHIGVININAFWAYNKQSGKVLFSIEKLEQAFNQIKNCEYKILIMGAKFEDFVSFNKNDFQRYVVKNFDMVFTGNLVATTKKEQRVYTDEGLIIINSLPYSTEGVHYNLFTFDLNNRTSQLKNYIQKNDFTEIKKYNPVFPTQDIKNKQNKLIDTVFRIRDRVFESGNQIFVNYNEDKSFLDLFVEPILTLKNKEEELFNFNNRQTPIQRNRSYFKNLLQDNENNYVIYGGDKTGKSALLFRILIDIADSFLEQKIIPFYIDLSNYKYEQSRFKLFDILKTEFQVSHSKREEILTTYTLRLFIDNFNPEQSHIAHELGKFLSKYPQTRYVITINETIVQSFEYFDYGFNKTDNQNEKRTYKQLFIRDIGRVEILDYVNKVVEKPDDYKDALVDRIVKSFRQYNIPFNYWALSLIVEIFKRRNYNDVEVQNNADLIEIYIQDIIGEKELSRQTKGWEYKQYITFLADVAYHLYKNYEDKLYSMNETEFINFIDKFITNKPRYKTQSPVDVFNYIKKKGIIIERNTQEYTFRLLGIFEYFLAKKLETDNSFLNEIITAPERLIAFRNELDLYSSNKNSDIGFLREIYKISQEVFTPIKKGFMKIEGDTVDKVLNNFSPESDFLDFLQSKETQNKLEAIEPLSNEEKMEFFDVIEQEANNLDNNDELVSINNNHNSITEIKRVYDDDIAQQQKLERYLFILGRVFRNIDPADEAPELESEIFDFFIESCCFWGFTILQDINDDKKEKVEENAAFDRIYKLIFNLMQQLIPVVIQDFIYNTIAHRKLEQTIREAIERLEKDSANNQLKLFLLYFLYIDLNVDKNIEEIDNLFDFVKINSIKSSILLKILNYMIFKCHNKPQLQNKLIAKLRAVQVKLLKGNKDDADIQIQRITENIRRLN